MRSQSERATAPAVAHVGSASVVYQPMPHHASRIDDVLAPFLFGLGSQYFSATERTSVLRVVDQLVRLKVDLGLLKEVHHAQ